MITHFPKMRRCIKLASFLAPALFFLAFIVYAAGYEDFALVIILLAFLVGCAFPHEKIIEEPSPTKKWNLFSLLRIIPSILFVYWLATLDGFSLFIKEILSSSALWDWRLITAVFIWHLHWGYISFKKASHISDEDIIDIFEPQQNAEQ